MVLLEEGSVNDFLQALPRGKHDFRITRSSKGYYTRTICFFFFDLKWSAIMGTIVITFQMVVGLLPTVKGLKFILQKE